MVTIWEGIREYFAGTESEMDFILFSNYGRQVDALIAGTIDLAWNTNLAWVRTVAQTGGACRALAQRDTDTVFQTMFVTRAGSQWDGLADLKGRRLALGSKDSAQAAILPVHYLSEAGLGEGDVDLLRINSDVGKHGDTGRSELDALRAVLDDHADAAAIGSNTWAAIGRGELMPGVFEVFWESPDVQPLQLHRDARPVAGAVHTMGGAAAGDGLERPRTPHHPGDGGSAAVGTSAPGRLCLAVRGGRGTGDQ